MSEEKNTETQMAECGACRAVVPLNSDTCSSCGVRFGGVSDETLGECGACGSLQPIDSTSCGECGVSFVSDDAEGNTFTTCAMIPDVLPFILRPTRLS